MAAAKPYTPRDRRRDDIAALIVALEVGVQSSELDPTLAHNLLKSSLALVKRARRRFVGRRGDR